MEHCKVLENFELDDIASPLKRCTRLGNRKKTFKITLVEFCAREQI